MVEAAGGTISHGVNLLTSPMAAVAQVAKFFLSARKNEVLQIMHVQDVPSGVWVAQNKSGDLGCIKTTDFHIDAQAIRKKIGLA
eukprot:m.768841 g.768841  ORF g.768841 m.768841 type:complete len:84 (+) comp23232_c2_seq6:155-406(+)